MIINMKEEIETIQGWIESLYDGTGENTKLAEWADQFYSFAEQIIELDPDDESRRINVADTMIIVAERHFNRYCFRHDELRERLLGLMLAELSADMESPREWIEDIRHVPPSVDNKEMQEEFIVYALPLLTEAEWLNDHASTLKLSLALCKAALIVALMHDFKWEETDILHQHWLKARAEKLARRVDGRPRIYEQ